MARDLVGKVASGYRLGEVLGRGSASTVYEAEHSASGRPVAVKVFTADFSRDKNTAPRLVEELKKATEIKHPHLCEVLDAGTLEHKGKRHVFLVMERLKGQTLRQRLTPGRPLPLALALQIASDLGAVLQAIHRQGGVHLGLSAGAVFLCQPQTSESPDKEETTRLLDLGAALVLAAEEDKKAPLGDKKDDIRALALLLQEMLSGSARSPAANKPVLPLRLRNPEVPVHVDAAIQRALGGLGLKEGFASTASFVGALFGSGMGGELPAVGVWSDSGSLLPLRGRSGISVGWVVGALAVVGGGVGLWLHNRETGPNPQVPGAMDLASSGSATTSPPNAADLLAGQGADLRSSPDLSVGSAAGPAARDMAAAPDLRPQAATPPPRKLPHRPGPPVPPVRGPLDFNPNARVSPLPAEAPVQAQPAPAETPKAESKPKRPKRNGPPIPPLRLLRP